MSATGEISETRMPVDGTVLRGDLGMPENAAGIVLFAHGSGSSRFSRRNRMVARRLEQTGLATLLFDLLDADEAERDAVTAEHRFDIDLLARRLAAAVAWVHGRHRLADLPIGLFGASTGAAAALVAAAGCPGLVRAVVSRGGRPDLAGEALSRVAAPTLLIVGGRDHEVLELNRAAASWLRAPHQIAVVPGATHLFEEPGTLEEAAELASDWFRRYLPADTAHARD